MMTTGQCRCEQVRFRVGGPPLLTMACHCTGCQRMTGSAFSLSTLHAAADFEIIEGEPVIGGLHGATRHLFCPRCMSWLFTRPEGLDDLVNVRSILMEDARRFRPFIETFTCEKLPWATTPALHRFERFPPLEAFASLCAEFARLAQPG